MERILRVTSPNGVTPTPMAGCWAESGKGYPVSTGTVGWRNSAVWATAVWGTKASFDTGSPPGLPALWHMDVAWIAGGAGRSSLQGNN